MALDIDMSHLSEEMSSKINAFLSRLGQSIPENLDTKLIKAIKEQPILYDEQHVSYTSNKKKRSTWGTICKQVGMDVATAKRRWQELIDQFIEQYQVNFPVIGAPTKPAKDKPFEYYNEMSWIISHIPESKLVPVSTESSDDTKSKAENIEIENKEPEAVRKSDEKVAPAPLLEQNMSKSDHYFMMSVMQDLQSLPLEKKFKFKKDALELLEKCMCGKN